MPGGIHPPLDVILSWPFPNYDNPVTRPKVVPVLSGVLGFFSVALMLTRLWVRIKMQRNAGLDDWLMVAAMPFVVALTILFPLASEVYGFNKHVWDIKPEKFMVQRKYILAIEVIFSFASGLIRVSILLFFRRLSTRVVSNTFRRATWSCIFAISASSVAFTLIPLLGCRPLSAYWEQQDFTKFLAGEKFDCFDEKVDIVTAAVFSCINDLLTTSLPMILYWNLRIPVRQKVALFGIFAIGYLLVAVAAVRAYYSWYIFERTYDVTWIVWVAWVTCVLEIHIGCICANAPTLKVFWREYLRLDKTASKQRSKESSKVSSSLETSISSNSHRSAGTIFGSMCCGISSISRHKKSYLAEPQLDLSVGPHATETSIIMYDAVHLSDSKHDVDIEMSPVPNPKEITHLQLDSKVQHSDARGRTSFPPPCFAMDDIPRPVSSAARSNDSVALLPSHRRPGRQSWT